MIDEKVQPRLRRTGSRLRGICLVLLFFSASVWAQEPGPNRLTPAEVSDGVLLLFDGATTFGWKTEGKVEVENGRIVFAGKGARIRWSTPLPERFELSCQFRGEVHFGFDGSESGGSTHPLGRRLPDGAKDNGGWSSVRWIVNAHGDQRNLKLVLREAGSTNENTKSFQEPVTGRRAGRLTLESSGGEVRNLTLKPLGGRSLFNGKDLTGWTVFPGKKSTFAVKDGAINVVDGPGDLQTKESFKDFVLQFECISHGKHLNSGLFFRCRPNEYQNGYEAQVRNQFTAEATQDYVVEDYDPKTNMLIEKRKVKSPAVDFGTGAIYRRQPARKEMSKDGEWFTMTVLAHGNHLATWVNGVQVTDWFDNRAASDNARTGCKRGAGHLSLQGHDPTTNLSFRNFRIIELPHE